MRPSADIDQEGHVTGDVLPVHVAAMPDMQYRNGPGGIVHLVDDAVVTDPDAPTGPAPELPAAARPGARCEGPARVTHPAICL